MRLVQQITFDAKDDAEAMRVARDRLGDDAVVISVVPVKRGGFLGLFRKRMLSVTAGLFEEDRQEREREKRERILAFQKLLEIRQAVRPAEESVPSADRVPGSVVDQLVATEDEAVTVELSNQAMELSRAVRTKGQGKESDSDLLDRVEAIQNSLHKVLARLEEREIPSDDPLVSLLVASGVEGHLAGRLAERYRKAERKPPFRDWLARQIPCRGTSFAEALQGPRSLFIGPTGMGKTTTIAKLGAAFALWENRKVLLLTADTYRIAAVEQLRTYAKILGVPMEVVYGPDDLPRILGRYADVDVVLLDTAGRSQNDDEKVAEYRQLYEAFEPQSTHLVLAGNVKYHDMLDVIDRMNVVPIDGLIATKLDETKSAGSLLNVVFDFNLPLTFLTAGQNVPNDIAIASGEAFLSHLSLQERDRRG